MARRFLVFRCRRAVRLEEEASDQANRRVPSPAQARIDERDALLAVYAIERQDDQSVMSGYLALLAGAIALLGALGFALLRTAETPGWVFALLPITPLPLFGLTALLMAAGDLRHRFTTALEERLEELIDVEVAEAPVPSHHRVAYGLWPDPLPAFIAFTAVFGALLFLYVFLIIEATRRAAAAHEAVFGLAIASTSGLITLLLILFLVDQQVRGDHLWTKRLDAVKRGSRRN